MTDIYNYYVGLIHTHTDMSMFKSYHIINVLKLIDIEQ